LKSFTTTLSLIAVSSLAVTPVVASSVASAKVPVSALGAEQLVAQIDDDEDSVASPAGAGIPVQPAASAEDALRSIRFITRAKFIVMPVFDKSGSSMQYGSAGGSMATTNEFATEVLNDSIREAGASTISWFTVNAALTTTFA